MGIQTSISEKCYRLDSDFKLPNSFLIMGANISSRRESLRLGQSNEKSNEIENYSADLITKHYEVAKPIILTALTINIRLMASEANFVPGIEIMKRFNSQVEAGLVQQPKTLSNLMNINTILETAPERFYPLQLAVMEGNVLMIQQLLKDGAYLHVKDQTGKTALANAFELGNEEIINLLVAAKDAEFQNSPHSPYAKSCTTESVSEFVLSIDSCDESVPGDLSGPNLIDVACRNSSVRTATEFSGELQPIPSARCDTIVSDKRAGSVGMDGEYCDFKASAAATTTDDDSAKTDKKEDVALASSASSSPSAPSLLAGQKQKKPLVDRFHSTVGKMLAYMRPSQSSIRGSDDNRSGSGVHSYSHSHSESVGIMNGFPSLEP